MVAEQGQDQTIKDIFTLEDVRILEAKIMKVNPEKRPIYDQIGLWVKDASAQREVNTTLRCAAKYVCHAGVAATTPSAPLQ